MAGLSLSLRCSDTSVHLLYRCLPLYGSSLLILSLKVFALPSSPGGRALGLMAKLFELYTDRVELLSDNPPDQVRQRLRSGEPTRGLLGNRIGNS
jgi:hypothetical protein